MSKENHTATADMQTFTGENNTIPFKMCICLYKGTSFWQKLS